MILCCQCLICVAVLSVHSHSSISRLSFVVFLRLEFGGLFMLPLVHVTAAVLTIFCASYFSIFFLLVNTREHVRCCFKLLRAFQFTSA